MGRGDEAALADRARYGTGYVGLVASSRRAAAVLRALREQGVGEEAIARVRSPAGLDLGPSSQEEIAVAVLAELVAWRHTRPRDVSLIVEAVDPVCGMTVAVDGRGGDGGARRRSRTTSATPAASSASRPSPDRYLADVPR